MIRLGIDSIDLGSSFILAFSNITKYVHMLGRLVRSAGFGLSPAL